jgi:hypothetical protein
VQGRACFPRGWSAFNPVEWVLQPLGCAFLPTTAGSDIGVIGADLGAKQPFPELGSVVALFGQLAPSDTGCLTVPVHLPTVLGGSTLTAFDSCGDDPAVAWLRSHRDLTGALLWLAMAAPLAWWVWRQYAPGSTGSA